MFPVGFTTTYLAEVDPNTLYPWQTWERIEDDTVLINGSSSRTLGDVIGENTHTLTEDEMPSHTHQISWDGDKSIVLNKTFAAVGTARAGVNYNDVPTATNIVAAETGGGVSHNIMQKSKVAHIWTRTA